MVEVTQVFFIVFLHMHMVSLVFFFFSLLFFSSLQSSYYPDSTNVSHTPGRVGTVEKVGYGYLPSGYGRDGSRGFTAESLQYLINRFGAIASFSGTYSADKWVLDIQRDQRESGSSNSELHIQLLDCEIVRHYSVV